jgi:Holliday junction resolvasome RuvABC endonuclease subunit
VSRTLPTAIGLDLSLTATGIADVEGYARVIKTAELRGMHRIDVIRRAVGAALVALPDVVSIEGYSFGSKGRALTGLAELGGVIRLQCWSAGIPYLDVPPAVLKRYALGAGRGTKTEMVIAARERLGYRSADPDEADALWLRALALDELGAPVVKLPKAHRAALPGVARRDARMALRGEGHG